MCFNVSVTVIIPSFPPSDYQNLLHDKIKKLHDSGLGYRRIAYWLNEEGYLSIRGKKFRGAHVHSIVKKKRLKDEKLEKDYPEVRSDFYLDIFKKHFVNMT